MKAEYVAISNATCEALWLQSLFSELKLFDTSDVIIIYLDNLGAVNLCHNPQFHRRTKHIDIIHHFVRDHIKNQDIEVIYLLSEENIVNVFTKELTRLPH
jgi:hypothetical protein